MSNDPVRALEILTVCYAHNGITRCVMNYVEQFDPARVRCDLVAPNEPPREVIERVERAGGRVFALPNRNRDPIGYVRALSRIVRERGEQVVHAHGNSATLYAEMLAARRGGAMVRVAHSHNTTCRMKLADRLLRGAFYRGYTHAMACGDAAGRWLFGGRPFTVLNNAVQAERFRFGANTRAKTRERLGLSEDAFALCHVGAFNEQKNHAFLLEAFAALLAARPDAKLLLIGDGPLLAACKERAQALGIGDQTRFLGTAEDVSPLLCAADAFALPSRYEGLPLTLVEAQCAGLPCLASDRITREAALTGLVSFAPVDDPAEYARALAGLTACDRAAASDAAIRRVREAGYDVAVNAEALMRKYETFLGEARA